MDLEIFIKLKNIHEILKFGGFNLDTMGILIGSRNSQIFFKFLSYIYDRINPHIYTSDMRDTLLNDITGERLLDVGVGTGYTTKHLSYAVGIDLSRDMLQRAKSEYKGYLVLGDASSAPFKSNSFDTIICAGSLYYFNSPEAAVRGFKRLLKRDGTILTITPNWPILGIFVHIFKKIDLQRIFHDADMRLEKIQNMRGIAYYCKARR
jgi:demethylmenaquinone methyltransferase/2-methoxy-6-polyprenyl-1,4-benzoquinol methylase|tara:strand:- start:793 stop:1413 length:621 start_codon:yes stop_codon:yes gene_type:complete